MRYLITFLNFLIVYSANSQPPIPPIGQWREHLPYNSAIDVTAGDQRVYCATPYSIFVVDEAKNAIERLSRVTGLNETGISTIRYDETNQKLFIAYTNSNIDIIYRNDIINVPDIKRDNVAGDKTIYNIFPLAKNYYLSTGLGVIVIDGERYEVKDSWFIGNGGNPVRVNGFTSDAGFYYAATQEGLKRAAVNTPNLANHTNWQLIGTAIPCKNILSVQGKLIIERNDSLFTLNGNNFDFLYRDGWSFISTNNTSGQLQLCERLNVSGRVLVMNNAASITRTIAQVEPVSFPRKAIVYNGNVWVADQFGGLSDHANGSYEVYKPNSPEATASGEMTVYNNVFYATAGEVNEAWNYQFNGNGIFKFADGSWQNINRFKYSKLDTLLDFITVAVDPKDETVWAGSYGGGLLHIEPGPTFDIFKRNIIGPAIGDPTSYRVSGLSFDRENNLWISNYAAAQPLVVRRSDNTWKNFALPFSMNENAVSQILIDDDNKKWIVSPKGNGLLCFDHGSDIDNTGDDRWRLYRGGTGNGNLPSNDVFCIAKDKNGFIWVGTGDGIGVLQCPQDVFTARGCEAVLPIVQQGGFANFLFKGEEVRSIAVDGADRKWVATRNGAWLMSPTGEKVIYQFTEDNSPLLSSDIRKITIDGKTGEVYFATSKGICSFRSTATEGEPFNSGVLVFPNPVPPGFSGTIGIRGLVNNAIVKITELDGRLVYQTRALGGQAAWDGRDYRGQRRSSGVYLVVVSDEDRKEKKVGKIVFLSR